jgi:hypothetical protein
MLNLFTPLVVLIGGSDSIINVTTVADFSGRQGHDQDKFHNNWRYNYLY